MQFRKHSYLIKAYLSHPPCTRNGSNLERLLLSKGFKTEGVIIRNILWNHKLFAKGVK